eukprot:1397521-Ditylum_brightwellii.AAC.1
MEATPAELVFGRDVIIEHNFTSSQEEIRRKKQKLIQKNNQCKNVKRINHNYRPGDKVLYERRKGSKHARPYDRLLTVKE